MNFQEQLIKSLRSNGERIAIEDGKRSMSYFDLLKTSNKITNFLLKEGLANNVFVGIQIEDKTSFISAIIGVINARCTFVPLNAALPKKRMSSMLDELKLEYLITSKEDTQLESMESLGNVKKVFIEDLICENDNTECEYPQFAREDNIYVYFTSGTTGKPKGIIGKNCSLLQFINWEIKEFSIDEHFRFSQLVSPYFDAFLRDVFVPLLSGGTICIPPKDEDILTSEKLSKWIDESKISLIHCVPSLFRVINHASISINNYKHLKYVLLSGEKIVPSELLNWYNVFDEKVQLVNLYGATESTMVRSFYRISPEDAKASKIPIGNPIDDTELMVYNKDLKPCNKLIPGDLYIVSKYISNGYLNDQKQTQEKFIKIISDKLGAVIAYKTGDKARILANGQIDLIGREDRQIKLQGIRVELDEIENIIGQCKWVKNVVVTNKTDDKLGEVLYAFVILEDGSDISVRKTELQNFMSEFLPNYMIPSQIVQLKEFPLLPNGKIAHKELFNFVDTGEIEAPTNDIEAKVLEIWKEILGEKPISITDSFQSLGGNSLSILKLISKIYNKFNVRIPLSELFKNLTIQKQANMIMKLDKDKTLTIQKSQAKPAYYLSSAQERIYYNYQLDKQSKAFNMPLAWEISGDVNFDKIERTFLELIKRHEALRTEFIYEDGRVLQRVKDAVEFKLNRIEVGSADTDKAIVDFIKPFDLSKAPLIRAGIIDNKDGAKIMIVDMHHIISDGISQAILFGDFLKLLKGEKLSEMKIQYKDYAEWEEVFKKSNDYISQREFWLNNFDGKLPKLELPVAQAENQVNSVAGGNVNFSIDKAKFGNLLDTWKGSEISTFSGLFSVFYMFLAKLTGQDDIVIGINTSGRIQEELDNVVGMFVKTLPIRHVLDMEIGYNDFSKEIHKHLVESNSRQIYDLTNIISELNKNRDVPVEELFKAMFVFQNFEVEEVNTGDITFLLYQFENATSKYPLTLFASENDTTFDFRLEYSSSYFTKNDMGTLIEIYQSIIDALSKDINRNMVDYLSTESGQLSEVEESIGFNF